MLSGFDAENFRDLRVVTHADGRRFEVAVIDRWVGLLCSKYSPVEIYREICGDGWWRLLDSGEIVRDVETDARKFRERLVANEVRRLKEKTNDE